MRRALLCPLAALALLCPPAAASAEPPAPAWRLTALAAPTNFRPGDDEHDYYQLEAANIGAQPTDGSPIVIAGALPAGLEVKSIELGLPISNAENGDFGSKACEEEEAAGQVTVSCTIEESLPGAHEPARLLPGEFIRLTIHLAVPNLLFGALEGKASVQGGGAGEATAQIENEASFTNAPPGLAAFRVRSSGPGGEPVTAAGAHPFAFSTGFALNTELAPPGSVAPLVASGGDPKDLEFPLPAGLLGNPTATTRCTAAQLVAQHEVVIEGVTRYVSECPDSSAVGTILITQLEGVAGGEQAGAVYNLVPSPGMPAQFGFQLLGLPIYIDTELRSGSDYGATARLRNISQVKRVSAAAVTLWGNPADPAHDHQRGFCAETGAALGPCPFEGVPRPFLRLPTSCADPLGFVAIFDSWADPGNFHSGADPQPPPSGCGAPDFSPRIEARPSTDVADAPSGLDFDLHLPQADHEDPAGVGEADLKDATVTLPAGLAVNPASADGLAACSEAEVGYLGKVGGRDAFTPEPAECPNASKLGTVEVSTPLLDHSLEGAVYLAAQQDNPFGSLLALYIALHDPATGIVVKLAGEVSPDPATGQLTTTVKGSPQTPFEDFRFHFFEGARAPLRTPGRCGGYVASAELVPWSAPAGATAHPSSPFAVNSGPGGPCPSGALDPGFAAGLASPAAASYSPFDLHLTRPDASAELIGLAARMPPGLTARLAGVPYCPEQGIAQARARWAPGQGKAEAADPSCPAASAVGRITAGAGAGPSPYFTSGSIYLAGPYKGAPVSIVAIVPALAGPFDLGTVVDRIALRLDPRSARVSALADPFPRILSGIPLDVRDLRARLDRPGFTLAPTSCEPMAIAARIFGPSSAASLAAPFRVGGCRALAFGAKLRARLYGKTHRGAHPKLKTVLTMPAGGANIARAAVALPRSEFLDQAHIRTVCTRVQFAAGACPAGATYGHATAYSPLLAYPLSGPVYLRSSSHKLPDLVADLHGPPSQPIEIELVGRIDSVRRGIRTVFEAVPDAPVSRFVLTMQGGKKGLLVNSTEICAKRYRLAASFRAQSGKRRRLRPALRNARCKPRKRRGGGRRAP